MHHNNFFHFTCNDNKHEIIVKIDTTQPNDIVQVVAYYDGKKREGTHKFSEYKEQGYLKNALIHSILETKDLQIPEVVRLGKDAYNLDVHDVLRVIEKKAIAGSIVESIPEKQISLNDIQYWKGNFINSLKENEIFIFGSNPEARHGAGAAKFALKYGAKRVYWDKQGNITQKGIARGLSGQTYALITKNLSAGHYEEETGITYKREGFRSVTPDMISDNIEELYACANDNKDKQFLITYKADKFPNGGLKKSLNGYDAKEMVDLFFDNKIVPKNIVFNESYKELIENKLGNIQKIQTQDNKEEYTFFWLTYSPFSQWHPSNFEYNNVKFSSAEQFMMFCKAKLFNDDEIAHQILDINQSEIIEKDNNGVEISRRDSVVKKFFEGNISRKEILQDKNFVAEWNSYQKEIKALGRKVKGYNEEIWISKRESMVSVGSREKYNQNLDLKEELLKTKDTILVEASPWDKLSTKNILVQTLINLKKYFKNKDINVKRRRKM